MERPESSPCCSSWLRKGREVDRNAMVRLPYSWTQITPQENVRVMSSGLWYRRLCRQSPSVVHLPSPTTAVQSYGTARTPAPLDSLRTLASPLMPLGNNCADFGMNHSATRPTASLSHLDGGGNGTWSGRFRPRFSSGRRRQLEMRTLDLQVPIGGAKVRWAVCGAWRSVKA